MSKKTEIVIDGVKYIPEKEYQKAKKLDGLEYCMVRTYSAGVFAGYVVKEDGKEVTLKNARRIFRWHGAASLSQLAVDGTSKPSECKFPCEVEEVRLKEVIEMIPITEKARKSIKGVPIWTE